MNSLRRFIPWDSVMHNIKTMTVGVWWTNDIFQDPLKCTQLQRRGGRWGKRTAQYPLLEIQIGVSVLNAYSGWRTVGSAWADGDYSIEVCTSKPGVHNLFIKASWYSEWSQLVSIWESCRGHNTEAEQRHFLFKSLVPLVDFAFQLVLLFQYTWKSLQCA